MLLTTLLCRMAASGVGGVAAVLVLGVADGHAGRGAHRRRGRPPCRPGSPESVVFSGLTNPTAIRFAPDGRIFVAEKGGIIKVFDSLTDTTPTAFADLNANVHDFWDRGLLGLALDPNFHRRPLRLRALHLRPHARPGTAPRGTLGSTDLPHPAGRDRRRLRGQRALSRLQRRRQRR